MVAKPDMQPIASPVVPAVRGLFLELGLEALELRSRDWRSSEVVERLAPIATEVESCGRLGWLPIEHLLGMCDLADELGGPGEVRDLVLDTMRRASDAPVWRATVRWAIEWFGLRPVQVARWAPHIYGLTFRGTGKMRITDASSDSACVRFERVPALCLANRGYVAALGHALEFFFELTDRSGDVTLLDCVPRRGQVAFRMGLS